LGRSVTVCGRWLKDVSNFEVARDGQASCLHCCPPGSIATLVAGQFQSAKKRRSVGSEGLSEVAAKTIAEIRSGWVVNYCSGQPHMWIRRADQTVTRPLLASTIDELIRARLLDRSGAIRQKVGV